MTCIDKIRPMNLAFLFHGDDVLMIHRGAHKKIWPNKWSGVGGSIEAHEHQDLRAAVLREIHEETGIVQEQIEGLSLRYIIMRHLDDELRQLYVYFGRTTTKEIIQTDEGHLEWISRSEWFEKDLIPTNRKMLEHYLAHEQESTVYMGINIEESPVWIRL
ncbi:8-oxo-dGTP diphosphatase [Tumebacillus sp. BK434]|uniref:NUDIX domain-containing protein n=1 Tax=Tumebacillus sp. BK434 TaxID=2512169 RepID=UPI0010471AE2|nr:NUDIX domain-containing protein [Tumebacillus sp. BK434]TCP52936.1 8-oxo-dGTP diphosphatase [Tumebacillus sp. BK434]